VRSLIIAILLSSSTAFSADLMNAVSLEGGTQGKSCKSVVTQLLSKKVGAKIQLQAYENLTAGSYNQEFQARFAVKGQKKLARLTGNFDCDNLQVVSIR